MAFRTTSLARGAKLAPASDIGASGRGCFGGPALFAGGAKPPEPAAGPLGDGPAGGLAVASTCREPPAAFGEPSPLAALARGDVGTATPARGSSSSAFPVAAVFFPPPRADDEIEFAAGLLFPGLTLGASGADVALGFDVAAAAAVLGGTCVSRDGRTKEPSAAEVPNADVPLLRAAAAPVAVTLVNK